MKYGIIVLMLLTGCAHAPAKPFTNTNRVEYTIELQGQGLCSDSHIGPHKLYSMGNEISFQDSNVVIYGTVVADEMTLVVPISDDEVSISTLWHLYWSNGFIVGGDVQVLVPTASGDELSYCTYDLMVTK